jgi:hypothetical protein
MNTKTKKSQARRKVIVLMPVLLLLLTAEAQDLQWNCIPGKKAGPITIDTSEKKLKAIFGEQNVRSVIEERPYGEPPEIVVTHILNSGVPYITVYWRNDKKRDSVSSVLFYDKGKCFLEGFNLVGVTLEQLVGANGRDITMTGLHAYEDRGQLASWGGGKFEKYRGRYKYEKLEITLDYCGFEEPANKCDDRLKKSDFLSSADVGCKSEICVVTVQLILNK